MNRGTMAVNSLPKTVTRQRRDCDLNPGPSSPSRSPLGYRATVDWRTGRYYCDVSLKTAGHGNSAWPLSRRTSAPEHHTNGCCVGKCCIFHITEVLTAQQSGPYFQLTIAYLLTVASQRYNLRHRAHSLQLPEHSTQLSDSNFLTRMLYKNIF